MHEVVEAARAAVEALDLDTCGTHTELKLTADGPVLIKSAARLAGSAITEIVERVHGVDLVTLVTAALLGEDAPLPSVAAGTDAPVAAAELSLIGADSSGRPWAHPRTWDPSVLDDPRLGLSTASTARSVAAFTVPTGSVIRPFQPEFGITNCAGMIVVTAPDAATLVRDSVLVLDGLGDLLEPARIEVP